MTDISMRRAVATHPPSTSKAYLTTGYQQHHKRGWIIMLVTSRETDPFWRYLPCLLLHGFHCHSRRWPVLMLPNDNEVYLTNVLSTGFGVIPAAVPRHGTWCTYIIYKWLPLTTSYSRRRLSNFLILKRCPQRASEYLQNNRFAVLTLDNANVETQTGTPEALMVWFGSINIVIHSEKSWAFA